MFLLPLICWWDHPPKFFFAISGAQKRGAQFFRHPTTLPAVSWAVDGVRGCLNIPSHLTLPCASAGYFKFGAAMCAREARSVTKVQILGQCRHWAHPYRPSLHWSCHLMHLYHHREQWGWAWLAPFAQRNGVSVNKEGGYYCHGRQNGVEKKLDVAQHAMIITSSFAGGGGIFWRFKCYKCLSGKLRMSSIHQKHSQRQYWWDIKYCTAKPHS